MVAMMMAMVSVVRMVAMMRVISVMRMVTMMRVVSMVRVVTVVVGEMVLAQSVNSREKFIILLEHLSVQAFQVSSVVSVVAVVAVVTVMRMRSRVRSFNVVEAGSDQAQSENSKNNSCLH